MSFADLKKQSKLGSLTQKLVKEVEKMNNTAFLTTVFPQNEKFGDPNSNRWML